MFVCTFFFPHALVSPFRSWRVLASQDTGDGAQYEV